MAGQPVGPLHGVPYALKDLYDTAGIRTTGGSRIFGDRVPAADATVVQRLAQAGAICSGKLNMVEFAYGPEGLNPHYGHARNPWDRAVHRMAGGSSSGSGVAVAAGLAPGRAGLGHRRLDPHPGLAVRDHRPQADLRAGEPCRRAPAGAGRWTTWGR